MKVRDFLQLFHRFPRRSGEAHAADSRQRPGRDVEAKIHLLCGRIRRLLGRYGVLIVTTALHQLLHSFQRVAQLIGCEQFAQL